MNAKEKIALITGGTGGIGTAICRALHDRGVIVVAGYYHNGDHNAAKQWQEQQLADKYHFHVSFGDVSSNESCQHMIKEIEKGIGPISILVNNAGITRDTTFKKMEWNQWSDVIKTNLDSVYNVTRPLINGMIERKFGRIINISSINGQKGQFGQTNYSAAKAGIHGFTMALAQEVAKNGITVNTVSPGYVATDMLKAVSQDILDKIIAQIPIGRLALPEEVARLVAFLSQDETAYITGANIAINGGQHMH
jgi:acetoacetyl-CoA reductase